MNSEFEKNGFVVLRNVVDKAIISDLRKGFEEILSQNEMTYERLEKGYLLPNDIAESDIRPVFKAFLDSEAVANTMNSENI